MNTLQPEPTPCHFCGATPAPYRVVVDADDGHHASNTLVCRRCRDDTRVVR